MPKGTMKSPLARARVRVRVRARVGVYHEVPLEVGVEPPPAECTQ